MSRITANSLDIVTLFLPTLAFRVREKVATPTSVILIGTNARFAVVWRERFSIGTRPEAWDFWGVSVPVVVIGAQSGVGS